MLKAYVLNDVAYAAKAGGGVISGYNEVNLLAPGALAIFTEKGVLVPIAALSTTLVDVKAVYYAIGKKNGGADVTPLIPREPMIEYSAESYAAGVAEVLHLGADASATGGYSLNLPTLTAGLEWDIAISNEEKGPLDPTQRRTWRASGIVATGDTAATILADAAAQFNAVADCPYTVTVISNTGLKFTADAVGTVGSIRHSGIFKDSTVMLGGAGDSTQMSLGKGTVAQVSEMLELAFSELGQNSFSYLKDRFFDYESNLSPTGTYDTYIYKYGVTARGPIAARGTVTNTLIIYLPASPATFSQAQFQAAMGAIFGTDTTSATESGDDAA